MMIQILLSVVFSFTVTAVAGKFLIPVLLRFHAAQSIKEDGPSWHMAKQGTPTMGGLMFIFGIAVTIFTVGLPRLRAGDFGGAAVFLFALVFGAIGYLDDYQKVKKHDNTGLTAGSKFLLQLAAALLFTVLLRNFGYLSQGIYIPFVNADLHLPWAVYLIFAAFVMVGTVNAVNLTDGLDGLAASVTLPVAVFYTITAIWWGQVTLGVFGGALAGGLAAFLLYNHYPAKVFMGDTGSLFLGGAVCGLAFALDIPMILILTGIIYIAETLSDIIQVTYFKATHGKRIFRMAPLHHHFEMGGWSEKKIVTVFTGITIVCCLLALWGVYGRFAF